MRIVIAILVALLLSSCAVKLKCTFEKPPDCEWKHPLKTLMEESDEIETH